MHGVTLDLVLQFIDQTLKTGKLPKNLQKTRTDYAQILA